MEPCDRLALRVTRHLSKGTASMEASARMDRVVLRLDHGGALSLGKTDLGELCARGLLTLKSNRLALTATGRAFARRANSPGEPFRDQHAEIIEKSVKIGEAMQDVLVDAAESPLTKLAHRRNRKGEAFLSPGEVSAGERLRSDYTRGQIIPRLGQNWQEATDLGGPRRGPNAIADLTDAALAARQRVEQALVAIGPELSGVLVDICCFLKGLERVELERGWPVRSAKVVLKTALAALMRHYEPERKPAGKSRILHWGGADYRPKA